MANAFLEDYCFNIEIAPDHKEQKRRVRNISKSMPNGGVS